MGRTLGLTLTNHYSSMQGAGVQLHNELPLFLRNFLCFVYSHKRFLGGSLAHGLIHPHSLKYKAQLVMAE